MASNMGPKESAVRAEVIEHSIERADIAAETGAEYAAESAAVRAAVKLELAASRSATAMVADWEMLPSRSADRPDPRTADVTTALNEGSASLANSVPVNWLIFANTRSAARLVI